MKKNYINISVLLLFLFCSSAQMLASDLALGPGERENEFIHNGIAYGIRINSPQEAIVIGILRDIRHIRNLIIPSTASSYSVVGIHRIATWYNHGRQLDSIFLPNSIRLIGERAFSGLSNLRYIDMPDSITEIRNFAFEGTRINSVFIPRSLTDIAPMAFVGMSNLEFFQVDSLNPAFTAVDGILFDKSGTTLIAYPPARTTDLLRIPYGVTHIAIGAFYGFKQDSLYIPDNVIYIGANAFQSSNLTNIVIPYGVTRINEETFARSKISSIIIPSSVTSIGSWAFQSTNLIDVVIPAGVTSIGNAAFDRCHNLISISIPESVTSIGATAFSGTRNLKSVILPNNLKRIESSTFRNSGLTSITIPESVVSIGNGAFAGSRNLRSVYIPESVTKIGFDAFRNCISLDTIQISGNVTIMPYAFHNTKWYNSQKDGLVFLGTALYEYKEEPFYTGICRRTNEIVTKRMRRRTKIEIPEGIFAIGSRAFVGCIGLVNITLPESLGYIGMMPFSWTSLRTIDIPENVHIIHNDSFIACSLRSINVHWQDPSSLIVLDFFGRETTDRRIRVCKPNRHSVRLIVPRGTKEIYQQSGMWDEFEIVERRR